MAVHGDRVHPGHGPRRVRLADPDPNGAGWYQPALSPPVSLAQPGTSLHWTNITGLVANPSRFGDELALMRSAGEIGQSIVRERLDWVWDGATFVRPG